MRRPRTGLARLLLALLLLQWGAATVPHARALAALGGAVRVELCGAHGARSVLLDRDGRPVDPDAAADCCDLCPAPPAILPPVPAALRVPVVHGAAPAAAGRPGPPLPPSPAPPQLPRAPPG